MTQAAKILLQGGTVLQHIDGDRVEAHYNTDVLLDGEIISRIGMNLAADSNTHIIDCKDKIVSPGFVDTHHHVWQTQLKGRHSDDTLLDYHPKGNLQFFNYTPEDIFWGELGGLMEAIDGGTTTIVDHAHLSRSPDHIFAGISATIATRIRSVFCYSLVPNIKRWDDHFEVNSSPIPDWFFPTLERVSQVLKKTHDRVKLGFGFDNYFLGKEVVEGICGAARKNGAQVITSHWRRNNMAADNNFSIPKTLRDYGLLGPDILLSHATGSTEEEFKILSDAGAYVSSTPATESQMAHGDIVGFKTGVLAALGADCHSNNPGSMLHAMQIGLAVTRSHRNSQILSDGKFPKYVEPATLQAFNLATIYGARSIRMDRQIGSLKEGKLADIVVFNTSSPAMACVADENPLVAVVRHATSQDVDTVIVGGEIRKEDGKLLSATCSGLMAKQGSKDLEFDKEGQTVSWKRVADELRRSRVDVCTRIENCNVNAAREAVMKMWGVPDASKVLI